jgi:hypothetical protein
VVVELGVGSTRSGVGGTVENNGKDGLIRPAESEDAHTQRYGPQTPLK